MTIKDLVQALRCCAEKGRHCVACPADEERNEVEPCCQEKVMEAAADVIGQNGYAQVVWCRECWMHEGCTIRPFLGEYGFCSQGERARCDRPVQKIGDGV